MTSTCLNPSRHPQRWLVMLLLLWSGLAAAASAAGPRQVIEQTIGELQTAVAANQDALQQNPRKAIALVNQIVSPHIDIQRVGHWVMGRYWRTATPAQRSAFIEAFRGMLLRTYATQVENYSDVQISYLPVHMEPGASRATVRTRVTRPGAPSANIDYRLYRKNGVWKVYDVIADGVSVVSTFRSAVGADIAHYGLDGVIARMNSRGAEKVATQSATDQ